MRIGPTFVAELRAAGLLGLPFAYDIDGTLTFDPAMTPEGIAAVEAVLAAHNPAKLPPQQMLADALAAGLAIVSTGTPSLSGTYAIDGDTTANLQGLILGYQVRGSFPKGASTYAYHDLAGEPHTMTRDQLVAVAAAIEDHVSDLYAAAAAEEAGDTADWPTQPVTIA